MVLISRQKKAIRSLDKGVVFVKIPTILRREFSRRTRPENPCSQNMVSDEPSIGATRRLMRARQVSFASSEENTRR